MASNRAQILISAVDQTKTAFDSIKRGLGGLTDTAKSVNGVLANLGVGVSLAGIGAMPLVAQQLAVAIQYLLHTVVGRCIHHGNPNIGTLSPNTLQRERQKTGVMKDGNCEAKDHGINAQQMSVAINKIPISHR